MAEKARVSAATYETSSEVRVPLFIGGASASSTPRYVTDITTSTTPPPMTATPRRIRYMRDVTAKVVAEQIIDFCVAHGDIITNLRLQKLIYYTQAWYLAIYDNGPLFPEPILAADNGPLQESVFAMYRGFGSGQISIRSDQQVPQKLSGHIRDVMEAYGHLSAYDLEVLSCDEEPWKLARRRGDAEISTEVMKKFYQLRLNE